MSSERIEEIRERLEAISPTPWSWNGYSMVASEPLMEAEESRMDDGDFDTPYEEEPEVCSVPPHHGDTSRPPHSDNARFIAHAPSDLRYLLEVARVVEDYVDAVEADEGVAVIDGFERLRKALHGEANDAND